MYFLLLTLFFLSFALIAYTVASILLPHRSALTEQIGFYEQSWQAVHAGAGEEIVEVAGAGLKIRLKNTVIRALSRRGPLDFLKKGLELSGLAIEWSEFVFYHLLGVALGGALAYWFGGWAAALAVIIIGAWAPVVVLNVLTARRQAVFAAQLPETLTMLAGSLKAGYSLVQAVDMVAKETTPPMAEEFKRVLADARLGLPVEQALDKMAIRIDNTNFDWMVMAIKIQREVGGNLVEVLTTLAETIRERETVARQIKVLTAEGRLSAIILLALPVFVGVSLYLIDPGYMGLLFTNKAGISMLAFSIIMMVIGALWLRKIVKIEV